ncbi:MAG TPA: sigma-70 family RNA polymerase sigma factor [Pyrinomonadaceae bacterium]|jgi:RNA polymerase sigma-70 factor (ECF subfamily)
MPIEMAETLLMTDAHAPRADEQAAQTGLALLVARTRTGEAAAFEELMICTQHRVVATAWRMLGNREDARDAAQEVYLRVFKYLDRYDPAQDFHGWLYRITLNVCRDTARKRRGRDEGSDWFDAGRHERASAQLPQTGPQTDVEAQMLLGQQRALVARALQTLPAKERAALVLRDLEGLSTEEVARILRSRPVTVRSQISSARTKIRRYCDRLLRKGEPRA